MWGDLSTTVFVLAFPAAGGMIFVSGRRVTGRADRLALPFPTASAVSWQTVFLTVADMVYRRREY